MSGTLSVDLGQPKWFPMGRAASGEGAYLIHGYCAVQEKAEAVRGLAHVHADIDLFYEGAPLDLGSVQGQAIPLSRKIVSELSVAMTWIAGDHYRLRLDFLTEPGAEGSAVVAYQAFVQTKRPE